VPFNGKSKALGNNREVVATFQNLQEHLKAVGVRLRETTFQLGRLLRFDPKAGALHRGWRARCQSAPYPKLPQALRHTGTRLIGCDRHAVGDDLTTMRMALHTSR